jgi:chromosomal replication initiation ATPase DnaA
VNRQLTFDMALRPALAREDFLVTQSNIAAVALVDQWPKWPSHAAVLLGPSGSGKTHLAHVFSHLSGARIVDASALTVEDVPHALSTGSVVVERTRAAAFDERALFHLLNHAKQQNGHVLLTTRDHPSSWMVKLPDLASRLLAAPVLSILLPDDDLLRGVILKHFEDRQIDVPEQVITYLAQRIPRSLQSVREIVAEIDARALAAHAEITRPFVAQILSEFTSPLLFGDEDDGFTEPS